MLIRKLAPAPLLAGALLLAAVAVSLLAVHRGGILLLPLLAGALWGAFSALYPRATSILAGGAVLLVYAAVPLGLLYLLLQGL